MKIKEIINNESVEIISTEKPTKENFFIPKSCIIRTNDGKKLTVDVSELDFKYNLNYMNKYNWILTENGKVLDETIHIQTEDQARYALLKMSRAEEGLKNTVELDLDNLFLKVVYPHNEKIITMKVTKL